MSRRAQTPAGAVVCRLMQEADTQAATVILTRAFAGTPEEVGFTDATWVLARPPCTPAPHLWLGLSAPFFGPQHCP